MPSLSLSISQPLSFYALSRVEKHDLIKRPSSESASIARLFLSQPPFLIDNETLLQLPSNRA